MSLYPTVVRPGAELVCKSCGHKHLATAEWLDSVCKRAFPNRVHSVLYEEDLRRLKCQACAGKGPRVIEAVTNKAEADESAANANPWGDIPYYPDWRDQG